MNLVKKNSRISDGLNFIHIKLDKNLKKTRQFKISINK